MREDKLVIWPVDGRAADFGNKMENVAMKRGGSHNYEIRRNEPLCHFKFGEQNHRPNWT